jgi:hypothetical protein
MDDFVILSKAAPRIQQVPLTGSGAPRSASLEADAAAEGALWHDDEVTLSANTAEATHFGLVIELKEDTSVAKDWDIFWQAANGEGMATRHSICPHLPSITNIVCASSGVQTIRLKACWRSGESPSLKPAKRPERPFLAIKRVFVISAPMPPAAPKWHHFLRSRSAAIHQKDAVPAVLRLLLEKHFDGMAYLERFMDARTDVLAGRKASALRHWMDKGAASGRKAELADTTPPCHGTAAQWLAMENEKLRGAIAIRDEEITLLREQIVDQSKSLETSATQLARAKRHLRQIESSIGTGQEPA